MPRALPTKLAFGPEHHLGPQRTIIEAAAT